MIFVDGIWFDCFSILFQILGSLEEITMPQNGIRPDGVAELAAAFQENKNLKV